MVGLMVLVFVVFAVVIVGPVVAPAAVGLTKVVVLLLLILGAVRLVLGVVRCVRAEPAARRNYPRAVLAGILWHRHAAMLGLTSSDPSRRTKIRGAFGPSIGRNVRIERPKGKARCPRAKFRPDAHGLVVQVRTVPKVGRVEFEKSAEHLADVWACKRVEVAQTAPGRLVVRALRRDPLAEYFGMEDAPPGTYSQPTPFRPYIGRDSWGNERYLDLNGITGITIGGLPRYGKTELTMSLLCQWAMTGAVQFVLIDGKDGGDYSGWTRRAWLVCGAELPSAVATLGKVHALMRDRLVKVNAGQADRNGWVVGPTPENPLIVTVVDECHTFFDLEGVKSDREAEKQVRSCRWLSSELVRKGGSVLFLTIFLTQKQTSDAIPTAIRDNCAVGLSFAVKTRDAAVAGLGETIRDYPSVCPTGLIERPTYIGVATATLPGSGSQPFVRLRVPEITEQAADQRARETEQYRRDPSAVVAPVQTIERKAS
jgi:S-DNA-T family DNA segregation ATPase FtsK/SpoIIIE